MDNELKETFQTLLQVITIVIGIIITCGIGALLVTAFVGLGRITAAYFGLI